MSVMNDSVEARHRLGKPNPDSMCGEAALTLARRPMVYEGMTRLAKGTVPSQARAEVRRQIGQRIFKVRKLYDENRTRYVEPYTLDGKPVHHTTWRLWEEGEYLANPEVMIEFCERTGATMDWIYRGILAGVDEDLKAAMFADDPSLATAYRAELASRRVPLPQPAPPPPPEPTKAAVPEEPARGRRRRGVRQLEEKKPRKR